jgi:hypothetical protein
MAFLIPAAQAADNGWPEELAKVHSMVKANFGDVAFDRVTVNREGNVTDVSIKLKNIPAKFRDSARARSQKNTGAKAGDDDLYLATSFVELLEPDFDVFGFDVFPIADLFTYYYGFVAFNFGKKIKRYAEISVADADSVDVQNIKKKLKIKKSTAHVRFVEDTVEDEGLYVLYVELGPYANDNYFCVGCG